MVKLALTEARAIVLQAQGISRGKLTATPLDIVRRLGIVQLDSIAVMARSHELVMYTRLGAIGPDSIAHWLWSPGEPTTFEYMAHAACIVPLTLWPLFSFRRRAYCKYGWLGEPLPKATCEYVIDRIRSEGPLTVTDFGAIARSGGWERPSQIKMTLDWLLQTGDLICTRRKGWKRVYDLAERVVPQGLRHAEISDEECLIRLIQLAARSMGVATVEDLADYFRLNCARVRSLTPSCGLTQTQVEGWSEQAWIAPDAATGQLELHPPMLLSPFDSLIWYRPRSRRLFGFAPILEAYKPAAKRQYGYYCMPLLVDGSLQGLVDPRRENGCLVAEVVILDNDEAVRPMAVALAEAATWVGCDAVRLQRTDPVVRGKILAQLLAER